MKTSTRIPVDLTGLKCPLPIVKLNKFIKQVSPGDELLVKADDPAFPLDVKAWTRKTGHELVEVVSLGTVWTALIRRQEQPEGSAA
jgi:TusA-related sulfurtransferase